MLTSLILGTEFEYVMKLTAEMLKKFQSFITSSRYVILFRQNFCQFKKMKSLKIIFLLFLSPGDCAKGDVNSTRFGNKTNLGEFDDFEFFKKFKVDPTEKQQAFIKDRAGRLKKLDMGMFSANI